MLNCEVTFSSGTIIFEEGGIGDKLYVIKTGKVQILKSMRKTEYVVAVLGKGDFFGEMALVSKSARFATAQAMTETVALALDRDQFLKLIKGKSDIACQIIEGLVNRLRKSDETVSALIQKNEESLVLETLSKWLVVERNSTDVLNASEWVAEQLGMKTRETEAVIRNLAMMDMLTITHNRVSMNGDGGRQKFEILQRTESSESPWFKA